MAAIQTLTWDILPVDGGARRPGLADIGGATVTDRGGIDKGSDIYADMMNQIQRQIAALGSAIPVAIVWVKYNAGVGSVFRAIGPGSSVPSVDFFSLDDPGPHTTGTTRISWVAGTLPPLTADPRVVLHQGPGGEPWATLVGGDPNAIEVFTVDTSNSPADLNFSVAIY